MRKILHLPVLVIGKATCFLGKLVIIFRPVLDKLGLQDILDRAIYVSRAPFDKELWDFIFTSLRDVYLPSQKTETRGAWALQNHTNLLQRGSVQQYSQLGTGVSSTWFWTWRAERKDTAPCLHSGQRSDGVASGREVEGSVHCLVGYADIRS